MSYTKQEFVSGQILKAEHLNNMESGIESNDAAIDTLTKEIKKITPDWNENDYTSLSYIRHKPFCSVKSGIVSDVSEVEITDKGAIDSPSSLFPRLPETSLIPGVVYTISFDDTTVQCKYIIRDDVRYIGNLALAINTYPDAEDTGEPFVIYERDIEYNGYEAVFVSGKTTFPAGFYHVVISIEEDQIIKIPQEYMPDDIIISSSTEGSTKKFKITVDDSGTLTATEVTE